jgi:hypothetical protein
VDACLVTGRGEVGHQQATLDLKSLSGTDRDFGAPGLHCRAGEDRALIVRCAWTTDADPFDAFLEHTRHLGDCALDALVPRGRGRLARSHRHSSRLKGRERLDPEVELAEWPLVLG